MGEFLNHAVTVGDLLYAGLIGLALLLLSLGLIVIAVNQGWVK